ncbi:MAG: chromosome segregation protein SMC, partial [Actinobacteria bacterium]|nr:chromosome segregation protein SMC [Actinomycetota bacterium]
LTRLQDLLSEIRRQLKPLGRQADVARKAAVVQADVRDARARILADDVVTARTALEQELADETVLRERRAEVEAAIARSRQTETALEATLREDLPALAAAQETWFSLSGLRERLRGTAGLAAERMRNARDGAEPVTPSGRDPEEQLAEAERVRAQEQRIGTEVERHRGTLDETLAGRRQAEAQHAEEERRVAGLQRAAADRREGLARLRGQVHALRSRAAAADEELGRLTFAREEAVTRADRAQRDFTSLESRVAGLDAGEEGLDAEHEGATSALHDLEDRLAKTREEAQSAERERTGLAARKEALELGLNPKDGAGALLAAGDCVAGLLGSVAALLTVRPGFETAVAAALGSTADAVAVEHVDAAIGAIDHLKSDDLGRAGLVLGSGGADSRTGGADEVGAGGRPALPEGATYAVDVVELPAALRPALRGLLDRVAVVADLAAARSIVSTMPEVTAVTRDGDVLGPLFASGGSSSQPSLIEVQAAVEEVTQQLTDANHACERLGFDLSRLEEERAQAQRRVDVALAKLHESDATLAAVAEELGQLGSMARSAKAEAARVASAIAAAEEARDRDLSGLADLEARLSAADHAPDEEPDTAERERLADRARAARQAEMDARLALRTAEERARALAGTADSLVHAARAERDARARAVARRERLVREGEVAEAVGRGVAVVLARLEASVAAAAEQRAAVERARRSREEELMAARTTLRDLAREHDELVNTVHRDELARAQQRMRVEQLEERALEELGLDLETLVADYGPDRLVPPVLTAEQQAALDADPEAEAPQPVPFVREEQLKRLRAAERALSMLGRVNPLALEEFTALEE